jgi:CheY-like chemotaxis protein/two-component sensor histidine kinase
MELNPVKYEVASLISDTVHLNMMRCSKPIEFDLDVDENTPTLLFGDELRIKQILNNLLSNAYKYTEKGIIKLSVHAESANTEEGFVSLVLHVSDTGQGMTAEQIDQLFTTEYTRFNMETNRTIEGTGLGMNITYHLIKIMNGAISVESEPGEGTSFIVHLPQKMVNSEVLGKELAENLRNFHVSTSKRMKKAQIMREYMPYGKVLIVDDVDSNLYVAKGLMAPYGLSIDVAGSGFEAIEKIKAGNVYDIVFMDHMMPKMDGIEAAKAMRDLGYTAPIIALTANAVVGQSKIFLDSGFDEFISKPIDIRQLNAILNKFVRSKQPPEIIAEARRQKQNFEESVFQGEISGSDPVLQSVFLLDVKKNLPIIESTLKNIDNATDEEIRLFAITAHSIKSALANIGENIASKLAFALEKAAKEQNRKAIKMQTPVLIDDIRSIRARIELEKKNSDAKSNVDENPEILREQLQIIQKACADYDERPIKAALEALKKLRWGKETSALIDKIDEQLLYGDFEEVRKLAETLG